MFKRFEENGDVTLYRLEKGIFDCAVVFGRYTLKYLRKTDAAKELAKAIADVKR